MTRLTAAKKSRKKQSEFQKLWAKAEKLKRGNAVFRDRLDAIMQRIESDIRPVEAETARQQIPLVRRLLTLGQRKTLAQWQRQELDDWVGEILAPLKSTEHFEEVLDDVCRYDAFRCGIELDETASKPLLDQLREQTDRQEDLMEEGENPFDENPFDEDAFKAVWQNEARDDVERILNQTYGPEPPKPEKTTGDINDLFQDELFAAEQQRYDEYHEARNTAREEMLEEILAGPPDFADEEDDIFGFNPEENLLAEEEDTPAISNAVFKRMFRATTGKLHPDRELDPEKREKKQKLMARLLAARKEGDVMTIVEFYQQHVDDDAGLSKADEKQLIDSLKRQITTLHEAQEEYSFESPFHRMAFEQFYNPTTKKTDQAFKRHIQGMKKSAAEAESQSREIKSLKTLKPYLEDRYEEHRFDNPFEILDEFFNSMR